MIKAVTLQSKPHIKSSDAAENSTTSGVNYLIVLFDQMKNNLGGCLASMCQPTIKIKLIQKIIG